MIAIVALMFIFLTLEVFLPGLGLSALAILAVVGMVWSRPREAVALLVVLFGLQELLACLVALVDPMFASTIRMLDEVALLAAGLRVVYMLARGDRCWLAKEDWIFAVLFLASGLLSSLLHGGTAAATVLGFALSCKFFGFILFAASVPWKEGDAERALTAAIWTMPVLLLIGFVGSLFSDEFIALMVPPDQDRSLMRGGMVSFTAPFPHPGVYGWAMAAGALAAITRLLRCRSSAAIVGVSAGAVGAILSLRRRPLLALPVALFAVLLRLQGRQRLRIIATLLVIGGLLVWLGRDFIHATVEDTMNSYVDEDAAQNSARGLLVLGSLDLGAQYFPFGVGLGRFGTYASVVFYSDVYDQLGLSHIYGLAPESPHYIMDTFWPHVLGETGALGLLCMALFMWRIWRRVRPLASPEGRLAAFLLVEGLIESLAGPVFDTSLQSIVIAIPIGMALRSIQLARRPAATKT